MSIMLWGLILIVLGWAVQFFAALKDKKQIQSPFLLLYSLGSLLLVVDELDSGLTEMGLLYVAILFLTLLILFKNK